MKKQYIQPEMQVVKIQQTQMLCGSQQDVVGVSNSSEGLSWKNDGFDDNDYDY